MPDNCTIYCKDRDLAKVIRVVESLLPISLQGEREDWSRLIARGKQGELRLNARVYRQDMDEFCKQLNGIVVTANSRAMMLAVVEADREQIVDRLCDTTLVLGVVAEPGFAADPTYEAVVYEIAFRCDGLIFDGTQLLNAFGEVIMHLNL